MKNKNTVKTIEKGRIYITATFNNTIVTVTDDNGSPVIVMSCGMFGFAGTRKSTPHAATITTDAAVKKAVTTHNLRAADVFVKGIGPGREAALRVLRGSDLDIERIIDVTPIPHNGVKQPKIRRV